MHVLQKIYEAREIESDTTENHNRLYKTFDIMAHLKLLVCIKLQSFDERNNDRIPSVQSNVVEIWKCLAIST